MDSATKAALDGLANAEADGCDMPVCGGNNGPCERCLRLECLSVNLSAPLAAVARAAMEWRETADAFDADFTTKNAVNLNDSEDSLRAALDALEAEARKLGFGAPEQPAAEPAP